MGDVSGLIADPKFQGLSPADQRTALIGVSGDKTFGTLNDDDTHQFIRGVVAKSISASPPSTPAAPKVNMQPMSVSDTINAATGHQGYGQPGYTGPPAPPQDNSFTGRVGQRIGQNVNMIPHVISMATGAEQPAPGEAAAVRHMVGADRPTTLGKIGAAATFGPRLAYSAIKGYSQDPATLVGDVVTASPELSEMKLPANKQYGSAVPRSPIPEPPLPANLSMEQAAGYHEDLNAAKAAQQKYAGATTSAFDQAKQAQIDAQAEHAQRTQAAQESQQQAAAVAQQRSELGDTQNALIEQTRQRAQALAQQTRSALDARWNDMRAQVGEETDTPITNAVQAVDKAETKILRGAPGSIKQFKQMLSEFGFGDYDVDTGKYTGGSETAPWQTVRAQASAMSRAMASGDLGNIYPALKMVRDALEDSAAKVAESKGLGDQYQALRADEHLYRNDFENMGSVATGKGNPAARLVRAPNAAFARDQIMGKGSDLLGQALSRWDKSGELAANIKRIQEIQQQIKTLPKVTVIPTPEPFTPTVPEAKLPQQFTHPTQGTPVAPSGPESVPIPQASTKPGFIMRHVPRVVGKAIGGTIGSHLGHPLIGYSLGGELGSEVGTRMSSRMPPTPEAYTRTLLDAKEGKISEGEAARRIARAGGSNKTRPLPPPP